MQNIPESYSIEDLLKDESFIVWVYEGSQNEQWEKWLADYPHKTDEVKQASTILKNLQFEGNTIEQKRIDHLKEQILAQIDQGTQQTVYPINQQVNRFSYGWVAAAVLLLLVGGLVVFQNFNKSEEETAESTEIKMLEKVTTKGQKIWLTLHDGTQVKLNAESKLSFPSHFSKESRVVSLEGEGYFVVTKDESRPFIIKSGGLTTMVLGTTFNIRSYGEEQEVKVALKEGKVAVYREEGQTETEKMILEPAEMLVYNKINNNLQKDAFDPSEVLAWKDGILRFKDAQLPEIITLLERWYGVDITLKKTGPFEKDFTGTYKNKSLDTVLEGVCFSFGLQYTLEGKQVELY
ncbi:FecR domain-containing protein [Rapidithrix thailandica]|uniref:FecR domain-containing protein n=1 Tax=Rapidithrix thailandica TaxID=413964 RepID=A0AAW9SCD1_9BACT